MTATLRTPYQSFPLYVCTQAPLCTIVHHEAPPRAGTPYMIDSFHWRISLAQHISFPIHINRNATFSLDGNKSARVPAPSSHTSPHHTHFQNQNIKRTSNDSAPKHYLLPPIKSNYIYIIYGSFSFTTRCSDPAPAPAPDPDPPLPSSIGKVS